MAILPDTWSAPSSKVVMATVAAFVVPLAWDVLDGDPPQTANEWVMAVARALVIAFGTGSTSYLKPERRPAPSAKTTMLETGEMAPGTQPMGQ